MFVKDFNFDLPQHLIAQYPNPERTSSRLLYLDEQNHFHHRQFKDLIDLIYPQDLIVFNDTRVIPARLYALKPTGGRIEILIERIIEGQSEHNVENRLNTKPQAVLAHIRGAKSLKPGSELLLEDLGLNGANLDYTLKFIGRETESSLFRLEFKSEHSVLTILNRFGHVPLPPYMDREDSLIDRERYQTVYADKDKMGAVAAPTAGLHFDQAMLDTLKAKGVEMASVTLHVGAGTFQPMKVERLEDHVMHSEWMSVSQEVCDKVQDTKARGGRIIAIGTTSVRCLETAAKNGTLSPYEGETQLFITPGFQFQVVDGLLTNFHLPASTLLVLVCAFAGKTEVLKGYQIAIAHQYRFYSYGDAMFLLKRGM